MSTGGDKGGGTFKMNSQIVNVNSKCVFCCFAAVTNLHNALDRYRDQVKGLQGMKWQ